MKLRLAVVLATCVLIVQASFAISNTVVISQVYGGGGNSGATLTNDFVELFNRGSAPVSIGGWSLQYASATGTGTFGSSATLITELPSVTLNPGQYFLVQEASNAAVGLPLPTPDFIDSTPINMAAGAGKVALVNTTTPLGCNGGSTPCPAAALAAIVDLVGYGTGSGGANFFEGPGAAPTISATTADFRRNSGCTDTDNNGADFSIGTPGPRNTATSLHPCNNSLSLSINDVSAPEGDSGTKVFNFVVTLSGPAPAGGVSFTIATQDNTATVDDNDYAGNSANATIPENSTTYTLPVTVNGDLNIEPDETFRVNVTGVTAGVTVTKGQGTGTILNDDTSTPPTGSGTATPSSLAAGDTTTLAVTVNPGSKPPSTGISVTGNLTSIGGSAAQAFTDGGNNTFTFDAQVTPDTTPGVKTLLITISDAQSRTSNISISLTVQVPPTPADHVVISQVYGGGGNTSATYQNDYVELYNPTNIPYDLAGWTIQYASATGTSWANYQPLAGIIGPGQYFLIALGSSGATGSPLPQANIVGSINMSATTGKIALVRKGIPLSGSCPLLTDTDIVDFVGYGTSATCSEGSNAPAASNTTALFRKDSGSTDTNNNHDDFFTAAPAPRRTAPFTEVGPFVVNTDPGFGGTNAPHDSSITVNFSEPVDAAGAWYNVSCASGVHNDATVAHTSDFKEWVITPNTNFTFGEQCTVTITRDAIHDQDTDDSAPNTDTLPADYTWSFTVVAAGQPAPYPPSVHMTMGNPTNATADVTRPNNYLMEKPTYALSYNRSKGTPNWVSWHLDTSWFGGLARVDTFRPDPAIPPDWYRVQAFDFFTTGFDRGHMCPNADRNNLNRIPINQETYLMGSNMIPQSPANNEGPWADLESYLRSILTVGGQDYEMYIVSGPAGVGGTGSNGGVTMTLANGHVTVPAFTWKVALVLPKGDNDISRVTAATQTIAVIMPNTQTLDSDWTKHRTSVRAIEELTGYDLFSNVAKIIQNSIERCTNVLCTDPVNPPGVDNQTTSTREDVAAPITLNAVSPDPGATFTYTVSQPAHGTLSGSGATQTYTPAPDFNGNDSFTFSVNDGHANSNTATVNITVLEVNDAPTAATDAKSTEAGSVLTFPASDLTVNDTAGPENESTQTLSVTGVMNTPETHGAVALAAGQVTYTPMVPYAGPASFSYSVCDNGFTAGLSDPQCATGTVTVNVGDTTPPTISNFSLSVTELWPANHQMVDVTVAYNVFDLGDPTPSCSLVVTSNQPVNGTGDGDTAPDWDVVDGHHVRLRAERAGSGTGRIYTIETDCTDRFGNVAQRNAFVTVPKSRGR